MKKKGTFINIGKSNQIMISYLLKQFWTVVLTPWKRWLLYQGVIMSILYLSSTNLSEVLILNATDRQYITHKLSIVMLILSQVT